MKRILLRTILSALPFMLRRAARSHPAFRAMLRERDLVAQIRLKDGSIGRHFTIESGTIRTAAGLHARPDVTMVFKDVATALAMMSPAPDMGEVVHAAKNFKVMVLGPDALCVWFMQLLNRMNSAGLDMGTAMRDGSVRYTMLTNGGPLYVYSRGGRILRCTPIDFDRTRRVELDHSRARALVHAAPPGHGGAACACDEIRRVLGQTHPLSR